MLELEGPLESTRIDSEMEKSEEKHDGKSNKVPPKKHVYRWRSRKPPVTDAAFSGPEFSLPPDDFEELSPLWYFKQFWDDAMTNQLVEQTNLYSVQKTGKSIHTTMAEIEQLIGMQMQMGIVKMPKYNSFWGTETRYAPVADVMSLNRYRKLRQFLHANDNSQQDNPENKGNKLFKVEPILNSLRVNCQKIEQEEYQAIDEQIVPAKTKFSRMMQYNPKSPTNGAFFVFKNVV